MDFDTKPDHFMAEEPADPDKPVIKFEETAPAPVELPRKRHRLRRFVAWCVVIIVAAVAATVYFRYVNPYETDASERGYVADIKRQGMLFKTWEGQMLVQEALVDSLRPYTRDFTFSVANDEVASKLAAAKGTGRPVTVTYRRYWGVLPWRGATTTVVTDVK